MGYSYARQAPGEDQSLNENVTELRAKLAKAKRQALTFKSRLAEAVAARNAALEELQALKSKVRTSPQLSMLYSMPGVQQQSGWQYILGRESNSSTYLDVNTILHKQACTLIVT
jgi:hypothetical protein